MYTIEQIKDAIIPIAKEYNLRSVYLFGSYARGEADDSSDIDLLVDTPHDMGLFESEELRLTFEAALHIHVDLLSASSVSAVVTVGNRYLDDSKIAFKNNIERDKVLLYADNKNGKNGR